jgi:hypothetical protein
MQGGPSSKPYAAKAQDKPKDFAEPPQRREPSTVAELHG